MRDYELVIIIQPDLDESGRQALVKQVAEWVTVGEGEEAAPTINDWGSRQLAYEIADHGHGHYVFYECRLEPSMVQELERKLFYSDDVIRYLIVRADEMANTRYDYKQPGQLRDYVSEYAQILPRRRNRISARQQRQVAKAVKRARHLALMPFTPD